MVTKIDGLTTVAGRTLEDFVIHNSYAAALLDALLRERGCEKRWTVERRQNTLLAGLGSSHECVGDGAPETASVAGINSMRHTAVLAAPSDTRREREHG